MAVDPHLYLDGSIRGLFPSLVLERSNSIFILSRNRRRTLNSSSAKTLEPRPLFHSPRPLSTTPQTSVLLLNALFSVPSLTLTISLSSEYPRSHLLNAYRARRCRT